MSHFLTKREHTVLEISNEFSNYMRDSSSLSILSFWEMTVSVSFRIKFGCSWTSAFMSNILSLESNLSIFRSSHRKEKVFLEIPQNSQENKLKASGQGLLFNKVAGLRPATLLKRRLWHRCFPVNFAKFLGTPFLKEHLQWLLLIFSQFMSCAPSEIVFPVQKPVWLPVTKLFRKSWCKSWLCTKNEVFHWGYRMIKGLSVKKIKKVLSKSYSNNFFSCFVVLSKDVISGKNKNVLKRALNFIF